MTFDKLNLNNELLTGINKAKLNEASSLQQTIITHAKDDADLLVCAEQGDDKNIALAAAALEKLYLSTDKNGIQVLILTAHAQSALQICEQVNSLSTAEDQCFCIDDDGDMDGQAEAITRQTPIIVANPNQLQNLLQEHRFIFRNLELLIIDDIQEMVGTDDDNLKQIKRRIISDCTTIICSETLNNKINQASSSFTDEPAVIGFGDGVSTPPAIRGDLHQGYIKVPNRMKISTLMAHIEQTPTENCVVFTASKRGTDRLYRVLKKRGLKATSLHRKLSEEKRAQRFANFTNSDVQFLLVSDFSASDLDLDNVVQVINYDVPNDSDEYRFRAALVSKGKKGRIVSLVSKQDQSDISQLENELGQTPDEIPLPDKVKQKLKQRKNNKKKSRNNGRSKKSRGQQKKKDNEMQLPQPSYDKLSGGRAGNYDTKETGIVKFFKKLFS